MKKKSILIIVGLMAFALLGVMAMQLYFFRQSYQLKSELFDQSVNQALSNVVNKLEKNAQIRFLTGKITPPPEEPKKPAKKQYQFAQEQTDFELKIDPPTTEIPESTNRTQWTARRERPAATWQRSKTSPEAYAALLRQEQRKVDSIFKIKDSLMRMRYPNALTFTGPAPHPEEPEGKFKLDIKVVEDELGTHISQRLLRSSGQTVVVGGILPPPHPQKGMVIVGGAPVNPIKVDSVRQYVIMDPDRGIIVRTIPKPKVVALSNPPKNLQPTRKQLKLVSKLLDSVEKKKGDFQDLVTEFKNAHVSLKSRIDTAVLDSLLRIELAGKGIKGNYSYKITSSKKDSVVFTTASNRTAFLPNNTYETTLFQKDIIRDAGILTITFPEKNSVIMANLTAMMLSSGALLIILVFCFGFTIYSILRQKKISEMKTDFINNMTHEFKTPVSTIMIASETLRDPDISNDQQRVTRLADIIYDENVRLGNHIERVLNIARIDKDDLKLEYKEVEMHDLVSAVVDSMSLQLQKKGTEVILNLTASNSSINGDELHLSNVIFNLVDNANKYSGENARINITTLNQGKNFIIKVADNGIGMSRDQLSKIFDQFYRIPTGNLHDVKGFGLGLSYVNNIVKRLNGTIKVRSEKDKGSEFEIAFPVKNNGIIS